LVGTALRAFAQPTRLLEDLAVQGKRLLDVADFERDVIDADEAGRLSLMRSPTG
jgi:hypothetical protein